VRPHAGHPWWCLSCTTWSRRGFCRCLQPCRLARIETGVDKDTTLPPPIRWVRSRRPVGRIVQIGRYSKRPCYLLSVAGSERRHRESAVACAFEREAVHRVIPNPQHACSTRTSPAIDGGIGPAKGHQVGGPRPKEENRMKERSTTDHNAFRGGEEDGLRPDLGVAACWEQKPHGRYVTATFLFLAATTGASEHVSARTLGQDQRFSVGSATSSKNGSRAP
jgi:hypothetical protein